MNPDPAPMTSAELQRLVAVRPSERQLAWQEMEFYAFVHFGMNTMTDREWGLGDEDPALFDPRDLDIDQWMTSFAAAGMTGAILTAKHHDGFCLWPSRVTDHTVAHSPWRGGSGDLVREFADAARRHGIRLGIYLSPWDRHEPSYGSGAGYDDFFVRQLEEVLGGDYGEVFSVWFDGANGEGPDGRVQQYDWDRYHATIRRLQPGAVIAVCGPDVRWCGNEAGHARADEWSVVPAVLRDIEKIAEKSQQIDDGEFSRLVRSDDEDLGSRAALVGHTDDLVWYPAEVNTSVRPGWFHHPAEDGAVRSGEEVFDLWMSAVGGNATLLLNVPPDASGRIAAPDVAALSEVGDRIRRPRDGVVSVDVRASSGVPDPRFTRPFDGGREAAWRPDPTDGSPWVHLDLSESHRVSAVVIREAIVEGQRVEHVVVRDARSGVVLAECHAVGYQRILPVDATSDALRVEFPGFRDVLALRAVALIVQR